MCIFTVDPSVEDLRHHIWNKLCGILGPPESISCRVRV